MITQLESRRNSKELKSVAEILECTLYGSGVFDDYDEVLETMDVASAIAYHKNLQESIKFINTHSNLNISGWNDTLEAFIAQHDKWLSFYINVV